MSVLPVPAGAAPAGPEPAWCADPGPLAADRLPGRVDLRDCDLRGRLIRSVWGTLARVPHGAASVSAHLLRTDGAAQLTLALDPRRQILAITDRFFQPGPDRDEEQGGSRNACHDDTWSLGPAAWPRGAVINWKFYAPGTERRLRKGRGAALVNAVRRAASASTDCTRESRFAPLPNIHQRYSGRTQAAPNISGGSCAERDGVNSFGWVNFDDLDSEVLAVSCTWQEGHHSVEGDMALQGRKPWWTPSGKRTRASCPRGAHVIASVAVHETLHIFGLGHVEGGEHADLTMAPYIQSCDQKAATLGRGDYLGLMELYGPR
ncbi:matrixin family metalloprotease [Spirillospora sp. CA-294931]|uniref:matrixin family metalloprotease n=1 Tax=Spirillospora sp. CA-294931 TaxID=3240042 RepID=UPI003D89C604